MITGYKKLIFGFDAEKEGIFGGVSMVGTQ